MASSPAAHLVAEGRVGLVVLADAPPALAASLVAALADARVERFLGASASEAVAARAATHRAAASLHMVLGSAAR